jgi:hypothetical protein
MTASIANSALSVSGPDQCGHLFDDLRPKLLTLRDSPRNLKPLTTLTLRQEEGRDTKEQFYFFSKTKMTMTHCCRGTGGWEIERGARERTSSREGRGGNEGVTPIGMLPVTG